MKLATVGLFLAAAFLAMCGTGQQPLPKSSPSTSPAPSTMPTPSTSSTPSTQPWQEVPVVDAELGPCSAEFQVNDGKGKPVFGAKVKVHITYGFMGVKKMDLEAQTNVNGKVKFAGLPAKVHNPPLEFRAAKDQLIGLASANPASECQARHDIVLEKPKPEQGSAPAASPAR